MSDEATDPVLAELQSYEDAGELIPGAAAKLAPIFSAGLRGLPAHMIAETIAKRLESDFGKQHRNPAHAPAEGQTALRQVLGRYAGRLANGQETADRLAGEWGAELATMPPAKLAAEVTRRLADYRNNPDLKTSRPIPASEQRLVDLIFREFPEASSPGALARELSMELANASEDLVRRRLAFKLGLPADDPRRKAAPSKAAAGSSPKPSHRSRL
jgi:hypothetical protein